MRKPYRCEIDFKCQAAKNKNAHALARGSADGQGLLLLHLPEELVAQCVLPGVDARRLALVDACCTRMSRAVRRLRPSKLPHVAHTEAHGRFVGRRPTPRRRGAGGR